MNIVLLSGGSGKRLWPLSNEIRSKQFLKVIKDKNDQTYSMLQRVYRQLQTAGFDNKILITTSATQIDAIKNQLGDYVSVVVEPERRNTYPAIALSVAYLHLVRKCSFDETVIVLPVDPFVENDFFQLLHHLDNAVQSDASDIVLMGVKPSYPSEKYGYIVPAETLNNINRVAEFKEKPSDTVAQQLISQGGLWNCGIFAFRAGYMINYLKEKIAFSGYHDVVQQYSKLTKTSFDYEVVERSKSVSVITYNGEWKDLGTWNTLTEVMSETSIGNVIKSHDCTNTHIINETEIPIVAMGTSNMVIAAGPDGILVADKEQSSYIRNQVEHIDQRPMFEEREWGEYRVLDLSVDTDGVKSLTKTKIIKQGAEIPYQVHPHRDEVWTVLSGKCIIIINNRAHEALAGDTYSIPGGAKHGLRAVTDVKILEVQVGEELRDDGTVMSDI